MSSQPSGEQLCLNSALSVCLSIMSASRTPLSQNELDFLPLATKRLLNNTVLQILINTAVLVLDYELESKVAFRVGKRKVSNNMMIDLQKLR